MTTKPYTLQDLRDDLLIKAQTLNAQDKRDEAIRAALEAERLDERIQKLARGEPK